MILLLIAGGLTFSTVNAQLQQSDTIKSGNGTTIININPPQQKKQTTPKKNLQPPAPEKSNEFTFVLPATDSFLSVNSATWWLIILSLAGMAMLVAILFLIGIVISRNRSCNMRCGCGFNNCNGCFQHNGNLNHSGNIGHNGNIRHSGTVEHRHIHPEPVIPGTAAAPEVKNNAKEQA